MTSSKDFAPIRTLLYNIGQSEHGGDAIHWSKCTSIPSGDFPPYNKKIIKKHNFKEITDQRTAGTKPLSLFHQSKLSLNYRPITTLSAVTSSKAQKKLHRHSPGIFHFSPIRNAPLKRKPHNHRIRKLWAWNPCISSMNQNHPFKVSTNQKTAVASSRDFPPIKHRPIRTLRTLNHFLSSTNENSPLKVSTSQKTAVTSCRDFPPIKNLLHNIDQSELLRWRYPRQKNDTQDIIRKLHWNL